ncbi:MAG: SDR family oxidoreductase [Pseudonocardia sp.]|nr:SDR family oxidoreductase [Pseudonocardia sp.]
MHHDVTDPESWDGVLRAASRAFGPGTVLVNNAGFAGPEASCADMTTDDYLKTIAIDQHGVFFGMRAVVPGMVEAGGGSIVNISSVAGFVHQVNVPNPAYTAAKFAVRGLTKAAAVQFGPQGVRVNCRRTESRRGSPTPGPHRRLPGQHAHDPRALGCADAFEWVLGAPITHEQAGEEMTVERAITRYQADGRRPWVGPCCRSARVVRAPDRTTGMATCVPSSVRTRHSGRPSRCDHAGNAPSATRQ